MQEPAPENIREIERRGYQRASASPSGIGAAVAAVLADGPAGAPRLRMRVSDGRLFGWLDVVLAQRAADPVEAVERAAGDVAPANRLLDLEKRSPLHVGGSAEA